MSLNQGVKADALEVQQPPCQENDDSRSSSSISALSSVASTHLISDTSFGFGVTVTLAVMKRI